MCCCLCGVLVCCVLSTEDDAVYVENDISHVRVSFRDEHVEAESGRHTANTEADHTQRIDEVRLTRLTQLQHTYGRHGQRAGGRTG